MASTDEAEILRLPPPDKEVPFRLLDLPPEIVLRILDFAVTKSSKVKPIRIGISNLSDFFEVVVGTAKLLSPPAITRTCRLLRDEGLKMYYHNNVFVFETYISVLRFVAEWLDRIPQQHLLLLRNLYLRWAGAKGLYIWRDFENELDDVLDATEKDLCVLRSNAKFVLGTGALAGCYKIRLKEHVACAVGEGDWIEVADIAAGQVKEPTEAFWTTGEDRSEASDQQAEGNVS